MAGGMHTKPGTPLHQRPGPTTPTTPAAPAAGPAGDLGAVEPPPGTGCWITGVPAPTAGVVLGWRQDPATGAWHALVSAWMPRAALQPRHD